MVNPITGSRGVYRLQPNSNFGGGMANVCRAFTIDGREVVVKTPINAGTNLIRFQTELGYTQRVAGSSPHVPNLIDYGNIDNNGQQPFMVIDYAGRSLADHISAGGTMGRIVPVDIALDIFFQCCDGLAAIHRAEVVHRDVNPNNILLRVEGFWNYFSSSL